MKGSKRLVIFSLFLICLLLSLPGIAEESAVRIVDCGTLDGLREYTGIQGVIDFDVGDGILRTGWDSEWTDSTTTITATFAPVDISTCAGGGVRLYYNNHNWSSNGSVELSDGENAYRWDLSKFGVGWVGLPFDLAETVGGAPDLSRICKFTITNDSLHMVVCRAEATAHPFRVAFDAEKYLSELEEAAKLGLNTSALDELIPVDEFASMAFQAVKSRTGVAIGECNDENCMLCPLVKRASGRYITRNDAAEIMMKIAMEAYHGYDAHGLWRDPGEITTLRLDLSQPIVNVDAPSSMEQRHMNDGTLAFTYYNDGPLYCGTQCDPVSGRPILETDAEGWLRAGDYLTRGEAALAVKRLINAYKATEFQKSALPAIAERKRQGVIIIEDAAEAGASAESLLTDYEAEEWAQALAWGVASEGFSTDGYVTPGELMDMLSRTVALAGGDMTPITSRLYGDWDSGDTVMRLDASIAFTLAAEGMGLNISTHNSIGAERCFLHDDLVMADASRMFYVLEDVRYWVQDNYVSSEAVTIERLTEFYTNYPVQQASFVSGHPIMPLSEDGHVRYGNAMTRKDAILGCWRLYTSMEPANDYMTADEVGLNSHTIDPALLAKQSELPPVTRENFPVLAAAHDYTQYWSAYYGCDRYLSEDEVRAYKMAGVECLALPYAFGLFEYPDFTPGQVNRWRLEDLDRVIGLCIKYDIHLILDCNAFPGCGGYPLGLVGPGSYPERHAFIFTDCPDIMKLMHDYWLMLARRYANVPAQYLSFYLLHEEGFDVNQAHVDFFTGLIDEIRQYNPERVIGQCIWLPTVYDDPDVEYGIDTIHDKAMFAMGIKGTADNKTSLFMSYYGHGIVGIDNPWGVRTDLQYPMYDYRENFAYDDGNAPLTIHTEKGIAQIVVTAAMHATEGEPENQFGYHLVLDGKAALEGDYTDTAEVVYDNYLKKNAQRRTITLNAPITELQLPAAKYCAVEVCAIELKFEDGSTKCLNSIPYPMIQHPACSDVYVDESNVATTEVMIDAEFFYGKWLAAFKAFTERQNVGMVIEESSAGNEVLYQLHYDALRQWQIEIIKNCNEHGVTYCAGWSSQILGMQTGVQCVEWNYNDLHGGDDYGNPFNRHDADIVKVPETYGMWLDMNLANAYWGAIKASRASE